MAGLRCRQSFCAMCDEAVGANYLREVGTDLITIYSIRCYIIVGGPRACRTNDRRSKM